MKQQHVDYQVVPYPKVRRWLASAYRSTQHKPMIHGLLEVDVTRVRARLREHKANTGESLSFTAFLTACLAKAVDEHKPVQAFRKGSKRLIVFDEVDVYIPIEHDVAGQKHIIPSIIRAANRKTLHEIHHEIRAAQVRDVEKVLQGGVLSLPTLLFGPFLWVFSWIGRRYPQVWKKSVGTVGITAVGMFGKGAGWGIPPAPQHS
jgi:pyruvate/2-oxoglutarate dehydrogenase complex dihydrolipoamide acyltransferase (E2) component